MVFAHERAHVSVIDRPVGAAGHAPVVDGDREVVGEEVRRGETEIDDSGDAAAGKQDIVAEEIAVNRAFRQLALAEACLEFHFACEQLVLIGRNERTHCARGLAPPRGAAPVGEPRPVALRSDMKPCEGVSHPRAVIAGGMVDGRTVDPAHQPGRPAVQAREQSAGAIGRRRGHFDAGSREVRHQVQIERQFVGRQTLVQRQNVPATLRGHEIVRVLDARGDRRQLDERAERVAAEPRVELFGGDRGVDGH